MTADRRLAATLDAARISLEEAFMEATADSVEYHAGAAPIQAGTAQGKEA